MSEILINDSINDTNSNSIKNISNDSFSISLDWVQVPLTNVVYNSLDFKNNPKIEIFYTRSYRDYFRSVLFFLVRLLIIWWIIFWLFYYISLYIIIPNNIIPSSYNFSQVQSNIF